MEENNYKDENGNLQKAPSVCHYWRECLCMMLAAFLGGFFAIYFVADQVFDRHDRMMFKPDRFERKMMRDFHKMYERDRKAFDRDFNRFEQDFDLDEAFGVPRGFNGLKKKNQKGFKLSEKWFPENKNVKDMPRLLENPMLLPDLTTDSVKIKTEIDNDKYKIIIGLNAFQGDDSKVNYNVSGRKITVYGSSKLKEKNYEQDISFSQDFILPKNANITGISKEKDGNNLIIKVPLKYQK